MPRIGEAAEEIHGDEGLAGARRQREQRLFIPASYMLQNRTDGGILIIAARGLAAGIGHEERLCGIRIE